MFRNFPVDFEDHNSHRTSLAVCESHWEFLHRARAGVRYAIRRLDDRQHTKSVAAGFRQRGGTRKSPMVGRGWAQVQTECKFCRDFYQLLFISIFYQPLSPSIIFQSQPTSLSCLYCLYQFLSNTMLSAYRSSTSYVWTLLLRTILHDWSQMWLYCKVGDQSDQSEGPWLKNRQTPRIPRFSLNCPHLVGGLGHVLFSIIYGYMG